MKISCSTLLLLQLSLLATSLSAQIPKFLGAPFMVEECSYEINEQGYQEQSPSFTAIYAFDAAGQLVEQWFKNPGMTLRNKMHSRHTVFEYKNNRLYKSTEYNAEEEVLETLEHFYNAAGVLVRIKKTASSRLFNHEVKIEHDALGRTIRQFVRFDQTGKAPVTVDFVYQGDSLCTKTTRDTSGQTQSVSSLWSNESGDLLQLVETDGTGAEQVRLQNTYRYDSTGNWIERNNTFQSSFSKIEPVRRSKIVRRIVYRTAQPRALTSDHLPGSWADFLHGLQLDFSADGRYLARTNGRKKDSGTWTLDTNKRILSVTGKEHQDTAVQLRYTFENGVLMLHPSDKAGVSKMVKLP